jgi:hypothetical protein
MKKSFVYFSLSLALFASCESKEDIALFPTVTNEYDASKGYELNAISPLYGGINTPFIVTGNFGDSLSQMKVYFGKKNAVLVRTNGSSILGLVPKLNAGKQQISVVCGKDSIVGDGVLFKYEQTKSLKTLAGAFGDEKHQDGDLNTARFKEVSNIATVKGNNSDNIIAVESWWNSRVSLVSPEDNQVVTLSTSHSFGTPAIDNTREKFYLVQHWADDRVVYSYSRTENYAEKNTGINISKNDMNGQIWSGAFRENDDNHLYYLDSNCNFCEVDLENLSYRIITLVGDKPTNFRDRCQMIYSKFHHCFFASFYQMAGIYKIYEDTDHTWRIEKYAGFNGNGANTGHRLKDAQFIEPYGLTVTSDGDIYVINRAGNFISRISGDQVEVVAGAPGQSGQVNSDSEPLDARFNSPQDIAVDSEDNFYIAGGWDRTIRKLSIE